ncbi:MAG: gamma-glutamylcyclotransferase [Proteobacteria bacterium]|nr:gamma-glutamylcyclotransferase [Pseudomonadota bacterium]
MMQNISLGQKIVLLIVLILIVVITLCVFYSNKKTTAIETTSYFAYGSNMDVDQMNSRVKYNGMPRNGKLRGYKLVFNIFSPNRNCGAGNLQYTGNPKNIVEGVVYNLTLDQITELDKYEGYREENGELSNDVYGYKRKSVELFDGTLAEIYIAINIDPQDAELKPSVDYLKHFLKGRTNGYLSETYVKSLLRIKVKEGGKLLDHICVNKKEAICAAVLQE